MKKLVLLTENGDKHYAYDLWKPNDDNIIFEILNEIENKEILSYELLEKAYKHFNEVAEIDSPFKLMEENEHEVVIKWTEEDWVVKFKLE